MECDVAVLGGGPGGYPAAIRAAQLGASVVLIEQARVGGTCITVGCIPTKTWVQTAHALKEARETFAQIGVRVSDPELDFGQAQKNKEGIVNGLVNGITGVVKANGITIVNGRGEFTGPNTIAVEGGEDVTFRSAVIATGSQSLRPPVTGIDGPACVDSTGLLEIAEVPKRLAILGGGVIGVEFASIFRHFGSEVTIVEMLEHLIPMEDADASKELERAFKRRGIATHLGARATEIAVSDPGVTLRFEGADGKAGSVDADLVLVATGRGPQHEGHRPRPRRRPVRPPPGRDRRPAHAHERRAHLRGRATSRASTSSPTPRSARARWRPRTPPATTPRWTTPPSPAASTPIPRWRPSA